MRSDTATGQRRISTPEAPDEEHDGAGQQSSRRIPRRVRRAAGAMLCALLAFVVAPPAAEAQSSPGCRDVTVPVALAEGQPVTDTIYGRLCMPAGQTQGTIQVLVHGITYTHRYWDTPDPVSGSDRYNYGAAANRRGFATLAIDRIGSGRSSRPPSGKVTIDSNAYTVHQVIQALRHGRLASNVSAFGRIVYVGHSYGTWTGWNALSRFNDADAAVFTAAFEELTVTAPLIVLPSHYPAAADPQFAGQNRDAGWLTTMPGTRDELFYSPAPVDPAVVAQDEATKGVVSAREIDTYPLILNEQQDIRVPTLLVAGDQDSLFCREHPAAVPPVLGGSGLIGITVGKLARPHEDRTATQSQEASGSRYGGARCDTPQALIEDEKHHLGPHVPRLDAIILHNAGHNLNQAPNAHEYMDATNDWISSAVDSK